ncbi:MAG: hypothetical protein HC822_24835 [Oscillochloris sp.]|nr:hypothetical protein [Oscillochloris sp.]
MFHRRRRQSEIGFAAFGSILLSIAMWFLRREDQRVDNAQAERFGIFIGLWAPTFAILGRAIEEHERIAEKID